MPAKKKRKPNKYQIIITKFLSPEKIKLLAKNEWGREVAIVKRLFKDKGEDFWKNISPPPFQINSMAFFESSNGKEYLNELIVKEKREKELLKVVSKTTEKGEVNEIPPEQHEVTIKPKTILDFLNRYGSKEKTNQRK
jgi:hypothetical protein